MKFNQFALAIVVLGQFATGCAGINRTSYIVGHDPILDKNGGALVVADVCIQYDSVGDPDYYVVSESKASAQALSEALRTALTDKGVQVREVIVPFCVRPEH